MKNSKVYHRLKYIFVLLIVSYNDFFVGCLMVFSSILFSQLRDPSSPIKLNANEASWIASIPSLISPLGLLIIGILTDKIGRRKAFQISFIPIIVSFLILAYSNTYETILIGRTVGGLIFGSDSCKFVYASEICTPDRRQLLYSVMFMFVGFGMMTESIFAMFLHWQTVSLILAVMSATGVVALFAVPESPTWLRAHGRVQEAERAEQWLGLESGASVTTVDSDELSNNHTGATANRQDASPSSPTCWSLYTRRSVWLPMLIMLAFFACQEGSGLYVILSYSADVLRDFKVQWNDTMVNAFIALSRVMGSVMFTLMYNVKRRTLAITSFSGMTVSLIVIFAYGKIFPNTDRPFGDLVLTAAFVIYMFFTLIGAVPLPWTLTSEVFPSDVSGTMNGVVQTISFIMMFAVTKLYPSMVMHLGVENVWLIFTIVAILGVLFSIFIMPETKGVPLKDILAKFESPKKITQNV
ncbi:Major facilitator superfamily domain,Major facilitator, sugar transporter-like [Cinara cedri]|uniref:Major facilitator superfamily domain,Major facilitator, sugar transporter-like n=1 Tax=Cinara cedri TaxID=506608 RepID=A0A5E4MUX4_9HEMI|nr:Major facilitator superfamily domain,Major facilitator, sugar transporter-like [Cinara cedri]